MQCNPDRKLVLLVLCCIVLCCRVINCIVLYATAAVLSIGRPCNPDRKLFCIALYRAVLSIGINQKVHRWKSCISFSSIIQRNVSFFELVNFRFSYFLDMHIAYSRFGVSNSKRGSQYEARPILTTFALSWLDQMLFD